MIVETGPGAGSYYYHYDALGSIAALSNIDGEIEEQYIYDVYGKPSSASSIGNPYLFTGRRFDDESNLYCYRARYYSYTLGLSLKIDPISYADLINLSGYL
jgi:RHS repeat-associated protein